MRKFTNQQAVLFIKQSKDQSSYMSSIMSHELDCAGFVMANSEDRSDWIKKSNKETADFLRSIADALESED